MADVDIGEELLRAVRRDFRQELGDKDSKLAKILKRIQDGKGTFHDVALFSKECGAALSEAIAKNVTPDRLPDGQLYYNIANKILRATLKDNYDLVNMVAQAAQEQTDSKLSIHLAPQQAPFPEDRIHKIINGAADQTADSDTIKRRLDSPVRNVTESFYDDFVEENAEFRDEAGLKTYLVRQTNGKCCDWCASLAGRYVYEDAPEDVFAKHDNCTCTAEYITDRYRENVHTKKRYALTPVERMRILAAAPKPTRFTKEQAQNLQFQVLNRVANSAESGIIRDSRNEFLTITEQSISRINTLNVFGDDRDNKVAEAMRTMLNSVIDKEPGIETTSIFALEDMRLIDTRTAESADGTVRPLNHDKPFVSIHNHPSGGTFSFRDVLVFQEQRNCRCLYVVGNNGYGYALEKKDSYNDTAFFEFLMKRKFNYTTYPSEKEFLKECEKYGVKYFERTY